MDLVGSGLALEDVVGAGLVLSEDVVGAGLALLEDLVGSLSVWFYIQK